MIIAGTGAFLKIANDQTKIVPGHGPLATKVDFVAYRDRLVKACGRVAKLKAAGMTEDRVAAAKPLVLDIQAQRHADDAESERFVRLLYESVKQSTPN